MDSNRDDRQQLEHWDRRHVWHAFTQMADYEPLMVESAQGCWLTTSNGQRLLDGASSLWCNVHGHRHPRMDAAVIEQLGKVAHVTNLGMSNPTTIRLTKKLLEVVPPTLDCVFFSGDGASAVEAALKIAIQYWRQCDQPDRTQFIALGNSYHGDTIGSISVGGIKRLRDPFSSILFDVIHGPCPDRFRLPPEVGAEQATVHYLNAYEQLLDQHAGTIAAVIVEPIFQCAAGMIEHPHGFLAGLRRLTASRNILLIVDEIATGMGRTGKMWACQWEAVDPDIMCIGKGLTGGYLPMAATLTSRRVFEAFYSQNDTSKAFLHGHTYGGNPLAAAAALATLQIFEDEHTLEQIEETSRMLADRLLPLKQHPHVGDIRQRGLIAAVELVASRQPYQDYHIAEKRGSLACKAALSQGVWLRPLGNVVPLVPPFCISRAEIELLVDALWHGIDEATMRSD